MPTDLDVRRSAQVLIREHRDAAPIRAAMRADATAKDGDLEGYEVWRRIVRAVDELLSKDVPAGTETH